jgi:hypothetical protein
MAALMGDPMFQTKQRHGCLTARLVVIVIANVLVGLAYLAARGTIAGALPNVPRGIFLLLSAVSFVNVVFAIALFQWKRWGFYGFVATSLLALVINLAAGLGVVRSLIGLLGVAILYGVLQIGGARKGWTQLE